MPLKRKYEPTFYPFFRKANKQIAMRLLKPKCANLYVTLPFGEGRGGAAVIFCDTCCLSFRKSHLLGGAALCVVRTFLTRHTAVRDRAMRVLMPQRYGFFCKNRKIVLCPVFCIKNATFVVRFMVLARLFCSKNKF